MSARDVVARTIQRDHDLFDEGAEWADRILSALAAAGYAVVPREPTEKMLTACRGAVASHNKSLRKAGILEKGEYVSGNAVFEIYWLVMLTAAAKEGDGQ